MDPNTLVSSMVDALATGRKLWIGLHPTEPVVVQVPVEDPHCTLLHLGHPPNRHHDWVMAAVSVARRLAEEFNPVSARIGGVARFTAKSECPLVLLLQAPSIREMRELAVGRVSAVTGQTVTQVRGPFDYTPHLTFGKIAPEETAHLANLSGWIGLTHVGVTCGDARLLLPLGAG